MSVTHGTAEGLRVLGAAILAGAGAGVDEAGLVADHLVEASLKGHDSHGIGMVPRYVTDMRAGGVSPNTGVRLLEDGGAFMRFTGDMGFGQRVGNELTQRLIARAHESGAVVATLRESYHLGRIGTYAEQAIEAGLVSIHFVNVTGHPPAVAPFRGAAARLLTNPVCIGFPGTASQPPVVADMATSAIALGKVRVAFNEGRELPAGVAIDAHGRPTTNAGDLVTGGGATAGALVPFGLHKGYALMLAAELLAGALGGGGTALPAQHGRHTIVNSMLSVVIDPRRLVDGDWLGYEVDALLDYLRTCPPADPAEPVLVPGDPERATKAERLAHGIPLDATTWRQLVEAAAVAGIDEASAAATATG
ncbi:MAG: malate/lactate/ureidoglycolate dehydrogenase [Thermoleophilia bacterium]